LPPIVRSVLARTPGPLALLAVLAWACDPTYAIEGTVARTGGSAIEGATVKKSCPSGNDQTVSTDARGHFAFGGVGGASEAGTCSLIVEALGFRSRTVRTIDVCYRNTEDQGHESWPCAAGKGVITLEP
jgi:hypothetical protein